MDTERIRRIAIEHFGVKDDADRCEEAITLAVNEALEEAATGVTTVKSLAIGHTTGFRIADYIRALKPTVRGKGMVR